jgi:hypothetical protein
MVNGNRRWLVNKNVLLIKVLALFIIAVGTQALYFGLSCAKAAPPPGVSVKDLLKISLVQNPDKSWKITEKYKTCPGEPEKSIEKALPRETENKDENGDYKNDSSSYYTAQLIDGGEGYVTKKVGGSYECYENSNVVLSKYFIRNGCLVKKTLRFPKDSEGCVGESGGFLYVLKNKNWIIYSEQKEIEVGINDFPYPEKNKVYALANFEPLASISEKDWPSLVNQAAYEQINFVFFDSWVREHSPNENIPMKNLTY